MRCSSADKLKKLIEVSTQSCGNANFSASYETNLSHSQGIMQNWFPHKHREHWILLCFSFRFVEYFFLRVLVFFHNNSVVFQMVLSKTLSSCYQPKLNFELLLQLSLLVESISYLSYSAAFRVWFGSAKGNWYRFLFSSFVGIEAFCFWAVSNLLLIFRSDFSSLPSRPFYICSRYLLLFKTQIKNLPSNLIWAVRLVDNPERNLRYLISRQSSFPTSSLAWSSLIALSFAVTCEMRCCFIFPFVRTLDSTLKLLFTHFSQMTFDIFWLTRNLFQLNFWFNFFPSFFFIAFSLFSFSFTSQNTKKCFSFSFAFNLFDFQLS